MGEVVLRWALVKQTRNEHMSDEYEDRLIIIVLVNPHPGVPNILEITTVVSTELIKGGVSQADKH